MSKYNILIVEDELIPAHYLKKILEKSGHHVVNIVDNAKAAMEYTYKKVPLDLILMDIRIKGSKDGIATAKALQSYLPVAILFISAYADKEYIERATEVEAIGYLVKPIQEETLLTTIEVGMAHFMVQQKEQKMLLCDGLFYNAYHQTIYKERLIIDLSYQENMIFKTLLSNKNNLTTIAELENILYELDDLTEGALRTTIWRLRKKLPSCIHIETVYKSGYKLELQ
jgi:DNA-binding response OmpR family regulator